MRFASWLSIGVLLAGGLVATGAEAISSCSFSTVVGVGFGAYDVFYGGALDSTGSITYACQNVGVSDTIVIGLSAGGASGYAPRRMYKGGTTLDYNLYLDAARTTVWGDGTSGTSDYGPVTPPDGTSATVTVYGRIPGHQNVTAGSYSDTVVVTILF